MDFEVAPRFLENLCNPELLLSTFPVLSILGMLGMPQMLGIICMTNLEYFPQMAYKVINDFLS